MPKSIKEPVVEKEDKIGWHKDLLTGLFWLILPLIIIYLLFFA